MAIMSTGALLSEEHNWLHSYRSEFHVRALAPNDCESFRNLRLEALKCEGHLFGGIPLGSIQEGKWGDTTYEIEREHPLDWWRRICAEDRDHNVFGLFDKDILIGITMVFPWNRGGAKRTAVYRGSYIEPSYRGYGLSHMLGELRRDWTARHFDDLVFFIREDNRISRNINEGYGETYLRTESMFCADGKLSNWRWYNLKLK
jgi:hypothetical protein